MTKEQTSVDITGSNPAEVVRLLREVVAAGGRVVLTEGKTPVADVAPVKPARPARTRAATAEDDAAFLAAAGGWKDLDLEQFERDNAESRRISTRSAPEL